MNKLAYSYNKILVNKKTVQTTDKCNNICIGEFLKHFAQWRKPYTKECVHLLHLNEVLEQEKLRYEEPEQ